MARRKSRKVMINITTETDIIECPNTTHSGIITVEGECRYCDCLHEIHTNYIKEPRVKTIKCNYIVTDD